MYVIWFSLVISRFQIYLIDVLYFYVDGFH